MVMRDVLAPPRKLIIMRVIMRVGLPVTLKFADRVGEILTASPRGYGGAADAFSFLHMSRTSTIIALICFNYP